MAIDTDMRCKWFTLSVLGLAGLAALVLTSEVALQESNLPNDVKFDELRLLEPQHFSAETAAVSKNGFETAETRLRTLEQCLQVQNSEETNSCISILQGLLRDNPANGRLWLEMARMRSREAKGLDDDALNALQNSFDYAPREGWIRRVRVNFVLSIWQGLSLQLRKTAKAEILEALRGGEFVAYLADVYEGNPIARIAIVEVIAEAPDTTKRNFLWELQRKLPN